MTARPRGKGGTTAAREDMAELRRELRRQGWAVTRMTRHWQARHPDPEVPICHIPAKMPDWRGYNNLVAQLRRSEFAWPPG